jgi:methylenetetrahydrofolate dehydrogenase (NADP+)/methenyltetrahydrofolate cyclohydrolase
MGRLRVTERLDGKPVAKALLRETRERIERGRGRGYGVPTLASVHLDRPSPFDFYLNQQRVAAEATGCRLLEERVSAGADSADLVAIVRRLDSDEEVHGVLLEHPLSPRFDFWAAISLLRPEKDVDGTGPVNLGALLWGRPIQAPAVARAALAVARHYRISIAGRRVAVIGRSPTVGLPLALLLLVRGAGGDATVTVAHARTPDLAQALEKSDVIFSCAGRPGLLERRNVPRGAAVIDVGLSSVPDPARPGTMRPAGDADAASLEGWASALTPVPGGIGPVTVAQLMANLSDGWERIHREWRPGVPS